MANLINSKYLSYLLIIFPPALVTGPFLPDLIATISSIYFFLYLKANKNIEFLNSDFTKLFLLFYLFIVIRSFFTDEILFTLKNTFFYFRFLIFAYLLKFLIIYQKKFLSLFIKSFLITLIIISIDAIIEYFTGNHWLFDKSTYPEFVGGNRISGLFDEEFILGGFILSFFPIVLLFQSNFLNKHKVFFKNFSLLFMLAIFIIAILVSGERASLAKLIILLSLIIFFTSIIKTFKRRLVFFISLVLIICISIFTQPKLSERLVYHTINSILNNNLENKIDKSQSFFEYFKKYNLEDLNIKYFSEEHEDHVKISLKMFDDKKIFGHGVKMFRFKCAEKKYYLNTRSCSTHAHGIVFSFLAETGLIGFSFLLIIYFFLIKNILISNLNREKIILFCVFVYLFPFLPMGYFFNNFFSLILYTLVGIYLGSKKIRNKI